jgi:hypothetical protein
MANTLIKAGANLNIVGALGHSSGFYGFILRIKFFLNFLNTPF